MPRPPQTPPRHPRLVQGFAGFEKACRQAPPKNGALTCPTKRPNSVAALRPRQPCPAYRSAAEQRICRWCFWFTAQPPSLSLAELPQTAPDIAYLLGPKGSATGKWCTAATGTRQSSNIPSLALRLNVHRVRSLTLRTFAGHPSSASILRSRWLRMRITLSAKAGVCCVRNKKRFSSIGAKVQSVTAVTVAARVA